MIEVRHATSDDVPKIVELLWDDDQGKLRENRSAGALPNYLAAFENMKRDGNCDLLVAVERDVVVGCIQLNVLAGLSFQGLTRCLIEDVRIARDRRGKGYGRQLLAAASNRAEAKGCQMIELFVHQDRQGAHAFYETCGFQGYHRGFRRQLTKS